MNWSISTILWIFLPMIALAALAFVWELWSTVRDYDRVFRINPLFSRSYVVGSDAKDLGHD